jgi:asparagine N-glycosylation enzyme membrane subunit Stt3
MGGFYEEDSFGFLWMVLGFAFLVKAIREPIFTIENAIYAAVSGICFGVMAWSWKVFFIVPVILEAYAIVTLLWNWYKGIDKRQIKALAGLFAICFVVTAGLASAAYGLNGFTYQIDYAKEIFRYEGGRICIQCICRRRLRNTGLSILMEQNIEHLMHS